MADSDKIPQIDPTDTCSTINPPASLRSDRLIGFDKISDRFQTRMLIAFAGIRIVAELS